MKPALLVVLLLGAPIPAQSPHDAGAEADPAVGAAEELLRLERWAAPSAALPDDDTLALALDVKDTGVPTLRERANELRLRLGSGELSDGGVADAGDDEDLLLRAKLEVLERLIAERLSAGQALVQRRVDEARAEQRRAADESRRAEAAQQRALEDAANARSALLEQAYARVAAVEGMNATIAGHRAALHDETSAQLAEVRQAGEDAARLLNAARRVERTGADAAVDALLLEVLEKQRALLDGVLGALLERERLPDDLEGADAMAGDALRDANRLAGALGSEERGDVQRGIEALHSVARSLSEELSSLRTATHERWYRVAERRLEVAGLLQEARHALLDRVSADMRSRLHGLSEVGADNVSVGTLQVWCSLRFHVVRRAHDFRHLGERLSDGIQLGKVVWALSLSLFALLLSTWVWRRAPALFDRVKKLALKSAQTPAYARFVGSWLNVLEVLAPRGFLIALLLWLQGVLTEVAPEPELSIVVEVIVWVLAYQLSSRLLHMLILRLARRRLSLTVVQKLRILRSVRLALRYGFIVAYVLDVMGQLVGHGVLYGGVRVGALLGAAPILGVLVQRWREDIAAAYLAHQPNSRLARAVEGARDRWYGFFVAVAAFGVVAGHGAGVLGRDFVLGFDQSRKALAYLFRLRIERQAQRRGLSKVDIAVLPQAVREAFADRPLEKGKLLVDRFSDVPRVLEAVRRFPSGHSSMLLHGQRGMGRTTWLSQLEHQLDDDRPLLWWTPTQRILSVDELCRALAEAVGVKGQPRTLAELTIALQQGGPRVIVIDGIDQLFLRALDGYRAIHALTEVMDRTREHVFWLLSASTPAFRHLCKTRSFDQHIGQTLTLGRWSEGDIRDLIQRRQHASGVGVSFEDLIVRDVEGDRLPTQVVETEDGYIRLLWNFAEGNPRVAQLFWLHSLYNASSGEQLRVRLYSAPSADDLEALSEADRFALAAVYLHGSLTKAEAARACRLPLDVTRAHFARALALGLYEEASPGSGRYGVSAVFFEGAVRYLRRKNLLV